MIEMEYVILPTVDTSIRYMYRLLVHNGVKTSWLCDGVLSQSFQSTAVIDNISNMKNFALSYYRKIIMDTAIVSPLTKEGSEAIVKWLQETEVKLTECEISPKKDPNWYMKEII